MLISDNCLLWGCVLEDICHIYILKACEQTYVCPLGIGEIFWSYGSRPQILFDDFKEEMTYMYGYDSGADTTEDEVGNEKEKTNCVLCYFKARTTGGLKLT